MSDSARQESETLAQLIRSENNVLMAQRRSLAEEAQALKVAREQLESQLLQTQDELTATKEKCPQGLGHWVRRQNAHVLANLGQLRDQLLTFPNLPAINLHVAKLVI